ncbi:MULTISPECIES: hypothetical protein [Bradyrhizobium]|uniref:hypothetical protein n=1 Tax=Bradyrhizobium TaxID=374 RepID=UPI000F538671|nr:MULTISPECIES: hypothetical protein [Bradyrhizobium]RQH02704.1 hypothetical protein EHH60_35940 [Bradyrhizobium sp. RP6]UWU93793.1 hypothetical protein N2604_08065 [Bradyrhizobium sp. CB1015]
MKTAKTTDFPDLVEITADGTSIGKTVLAGRVAHFFGEVGRKVIRVQIESSRRRGAVETGDIFINLEEFASAGIRNGGLVGVLSPLFEAVIEARKSGAGVVVDWAGGTAGHRLEVLAATNFDATLAAMQVKALSIVMTTNSSEHMAQAEKHLHSLQKVAPHLPRALALSGRAGPFDWPVNSEQRGHFDRLLAAAGEVPVLRIPLAAGRALQVCADAGLDPTQALLMNFDELAARLGVHIFQATACATEIAVWWQRVGGELRKLLGAARVPVTA